MPRKRKGRGAVVEDAGSNEASDVAVGDTEELNTAASPSPQTSGTRSGSRKRDRRGERAESQSTRTESAGQAKTSRKASGNRSLSSKKDRARPEQSGSKKGSSERPAAAVEPFQFSCRVYHNIYFSGVGGLSQPHMMSYHDLKHALFREVVVPGSYGPEDTVHTAVTNAHREVLRVADAETQHASPNAEASVESSENKRTDELPERIRLGTPATLGLWAPGCKLLPADMPLQEMKKILAQPGNHTPLTLDVRDPASFVDAIGHRRSSSTLIPGRQRRIVAVVLIAVCLTSFVVLLAVLQRRDP